METPDPPNDTPWGLKTGGFHMTLQGFLGYILPTSVFLVLPFLANHWKRPYKIPLQNSHEIRKQTFRELSRFPGEENHMCHKNHAFFFKKKFYPA